MKQHKHSKHHKPSTGLRTTGRSCPTCGDSKPYKVVNGQEICSGCKRPLPTTVHAFAPVWLTMRRRMAA